MARDMFRGGLMLVLGLGLGLGLVLRLGLRSSFEVGEVNV